MDIHRSSDHDAAEAAYATVVIQGETLTREAYIAKMMTVIENDDFDPYTDEENRELFAMMFDEMIAEKRLAHNKMSAHEYESVIDNNNKRRSEMRKAMIARRKISQP